LKHQFAEVRQNYSLPATSCCT